MEFIPFPPGCLWTFLVGMISPLLTGMRLNSNSLIRQDHVDLESDQTDDRSWYKLILLDFKSQLRPFLSDDGTLLLYMTLLVLFGHSRSDEWLEMELLKVPNGAKKIHITNVVMSQRTDRLTDTSSRLVPTPHRSTGSALWDHYFPSVDHDCISV